MKPATKAYFVLCLVVLVVASCGPVTPISSPTVTSTVRPIFTSSPAQTFTPSVTVAPTATSFLPASWVYVTPGSDPSAYTLRSWKDADYSFFINSIDDGNLSHWQTLFTPVFDSFYGYEYFLHTDQVNVRDDLAWKIAQLNPVGVPLPGMRRGEDYFIFLVEKLLNEDHVSMAGLTTILEEYGFGVSNTFEAKDFFGKGNDALFMEVSGAKSYVFFSTILGIHRVNGSYQVDPVDYWSLMFGAGSNSGYTFEGIVDGNRNGFPEFAVREDTGYSGLPSVEHARLTLYEWDEQSQNYRTNSFELFQQECNQGACWGEWELSDTDAEPFPALVLREYWRTQKECPNLTIQRMYRWDGKEYPLEKNAILPPAGEKVECLIAWADTAVRVQDYGWQDDLSIQIISDAIDRWPDAMDRDWGPASRDYFRLRLGIWKDLRGESDDALRLLEPLAAAPFMANYPLASRTAAAYLDGRKNNGSVNACQKANEVWSSAIREEFHDSFDYPEIDAVRSFLGFASDLWGYGAHNFSQICSEDDAIFATSQNVAYSEFINPTDWFRRIGRSVSLAKQEDFNRDGIKDWLIIIAQNSKSGQSSSAWFFFGDSNRFDVHKFDGWFDNFSPSLWLGVKPDEESEPIYLMQIMDSLWVFRVSHDKQVETLVDEYGVTLLQIDQSEGLRIKVSAEDWDYKGKKIKDYVWDTPSQTFVTVVEEYDFESARQKVERMIFQEHDYASAISSVQQFLAQAPTEYLETSSCALDVCEYYPQRYYPGMYYLMGVAYEMSGQPKQAARTYYILWRDYPDSPYALLAQYKLEPVKP